MLMQMHEMQIDHDPDIASIDITILISPFGKMILIVPFGKMILIAPLGKIVLIPLGTYDTIICYEMQSFFTSL